MKASYISHSESNMYKLISMLKVSTIIQCSNSGMLTCEDHDDDEKCDHRCEERLHVHRVVGIQRDFYDLRNFRSCI